MMIVSSVEKVSSTDILFMAFDISYSPAAWPTAPVLPKTPSVSFESLLVAKTVVIMVSIMDGVLVAVTSEAVALQLEKFPKQAQIPWIYLPSGQGDLSLCTSHLISNFWRVPKTVFWLSQLISICDFHVS